jgi:hypothetical protein
MLRIRQEQWAALSELAQSQFCERTAVRLRRRFSEATSALDDRELRSLVGRTVEKARAYGITREGDVERFVGILFSLAVDFTTSPQTAWARDILRQRYLDARTRLDIIDAAICNAKKRGSA